MARAYENDEKAPPEFGRRVKRKKLRWDPDEPGRGLSVNSLDCLGDVACSIWLGGDLARHRHVVIIDLVALSKEIGHDLVALYDPIEVQGCENPCHFTIVPTDANMTDVRIAVDELWRPSQARKPTSREEIDQAKQACLRYAAIMDIRLDVIATDEKP